MSADNKTSKLYDAAIDEVTASGKAWKSICRLTGQIYRYEFDNILMVYMQRPGAKLVADFDTWKKVGRYVRRGSRGIAIFPSRALKPEMRYVFDISDTGGRESRLTWELDRDTMKAYAAWLREKEGAALPEGKESDKSFLKDFTEKRIGVIMDSEFGGRITEFTNLAGNKQITENGRVQEITAAEALKRSVMYAVFTRCGFDVPAEKQDFSFITAFTKEEEIYRLGSLLSDISCEVLRGIAKDLTRMEERSIADGRDNNEVSRGSGRDAVPGPDAAGGNGEHDKLREVRSEGDGVPEGEPQRQIPDAPEVRQTGGEDAGSGGRGEPDDGRTGGQLPEEQPAEGQKLDNGDVAAQGAGEDAGRGNRDGGSSDEVPLGDSEQQNTRKAELDREIEQELNEINSLGSSDTQKGSYEQASFLIAQNGDMTLPKEYSYQKPEQALTVPHEYVKQVLMRGGVFSGSKKRIYAMFQDISDPGERVKAIRKEYGQGGAGWPLEGDGLHGYDTFASKGLRFQWREAGTEKEGYMNWKAIERELGALIMTGEYYTPPKAFDPDKISAAVWQETMDAFFQHSFWSPVPNMLLYEVFTKELPMSDKVQFIERVLCRNPYAASIENNFENRYGRCNIEQTDEGISIEYYDGEGTKWKTELDWWDCAAYVESMIADGAYQTHEPYDKIGEIMEEHPAATWIKILKEDTDRYLSEEAEGHQQNRLDNLHTVLALKGLQEKMELSWDDACDEVIASDGETVWHGRQFYDYLFHEVLELDGFHRDSSIPFDVQNQFEHDRFSSHNPDKAAFIHRKTFGKAELTAEESEKQEESLWLEPLKGYFNEEIQYISVKTLIYDIFTTNLNMESKAGFLASVYGEQREGFFMSEYTDNPYGKCKISRDKEGIDISYPRADGTTGEKRVDYRYCADLILHMIEENDYLTEGIFERFKEAPEAFAAMPWFMEIYHEYKERMRQEPDFDAVSIDGQEDERQEEPEQQGVTEEIPETQQTAGNGQEEIPGIQQEQENGQEDTPKMPETAERVEGEVLNPDGSVAKPASGSLFPEALRQVEAMDEDLRDALEIYLTKCSAVTPYQPFLQMVSESSLTKEDNGEYSSGSVPYGYVNVDRHLQPDERVRETVQEIYRLFLEGNSLKEITRQLNSKKIVNPKSYKLLRSGHDIPEGMNTGWNNVTVRTILTNHAYVGASVHNKRTRINGKQVNVPKEEWIVIEDTHEPLVGREDFDRVQEMLDENVKHFHSTHGKNGFDHAQFNLIGKKIVCADCGKIMGFRTEGTRHVNKFYRCKTYLNTVRKGCTNHLVSAEAVNAAVFHQIQKHMHICIDKEETVKRLNAKTENLKKYDLYGKEADKIRKELQKTTEVKAGIFEDYWDKLIDEEQYVQISEKYAAKIKELSARLDEMLKAQAEYSREYHIDEDWKAVVQKYLNKRKLTKEMVEAFVDRVEVHEDANIVVHLIYDDVLESLKSLSAEREGGANG